MSAPGDVAQRPELWAPDATTVELETPDARQPCVRVGETWASPIQLEPGTRYRFVVDGAEVPDPRSRAQPDGVHGWSCVPEQIRHGTRRVRTALDRAVIYEIHIGSFSAAGTFRGAIEHLDHLAHLGVTHVEVMPVAAFDGEVGWGYDGVDLFAPHPSYGSVNDMAEFVDACHNREMAVVLDVVYNHLGPSGNYLAVSGPYFTNRYSTPWGDSVNLDGPGSDGVRNFIIDNALYWLGEVGVDGLRLDAVHTLFDSSELPLFEELGAQVRELGRRTGHEYLLVAESEGSDPRLMQAPPCGPGLDGVWSDDLHHCIHVTLTSETQGYYEDYWPEDLSTALTSALVYQGRYSPHRKRRVGRSVEGTGSAAFVVSLQNHDQVGNRAAGERLHQLIGVDRTCAAAALVLLSPFTCLLFQGEDWASSSPFPYFSNHGGELGDAVRRGRIAEFAAFGWDEQAVADPEARSTADGAKLIWAELSSGPHAEVSEWYRQLIALRRSHPTFAPGPLPLPEQSCHVHGGVVDVHRGSLRIVANLAESAQEIPPLDVAQATGTRLHRAAVSGTVADGTTIDGNVILERGEVLLDEDGGRRLSPGGVLVIERSRDAGSHRQD
ncbi:MAG: malto-oligosyltrehalose trehalohydrolase [Microthrixaceae bacterium]